MQTYVQHIDRPNKFSDEQNSVVCDRPHSGHSRRSVIENDEEILGALEENPKESDGSLTRRFDLVEPLFIE